MVGEGYRSVSRKEAGARRHGCDSLSGMANKPTRRNFLLTAPIAAAAASPLADTMLRASTAGAVGQGGDAPLPIQVFTAADMAGEAKGVQAAHSTKSLVTSPATLMVINEETKKAGKEFEWHATRDHVFQVLDGETKYELGGTPKGAHQTKPGEWLAPESEGAKTVMLKKGDYLFVPRMTPHKRSTDGSVTLLLISSQNPM
jgi:mannose-6-phosphate isomerase-like protein (cupin superfamily)